MIGSFPRYENKSILKPLCPAPIGVARLSQMGKLFYSDGSGAGDAAGGVAGLFSARLTRICTPSNSVLFSLLIASLASPPFGISTKANPLEAPETSSITSLQYCTVPKGVNNAFRSSSVEERARFLTRIFMAARLKSLLVFTSLKRIGDVLLQGQCLKRHTKCRCYEKL